MPSQHELQQALTWATDKCLMLDTTNQRLLSQLTSIRAAVMEAVQNENLRPALCHQLTLLLKPKREE